MTSVARPGGECWREGEGGCPRISRSRVSLRRSDARTAEGYQLSGAGLRNSDQSRHQQLTLRHSETQDTQSGEITRESVKLQSGSHLTLE